MPRTRRLVAALSALVLIPAAQAADIKVISANAMRDVIGDIRPVFQSISPFKLDVTVVETGEIRRRVLAGEDFDVIIVPRTVAAELEKQNRIAAPLPLIRVDFGLAVRADGPKPDISTPEALRRTFLAARTVLITDPAVGGVSGVHLMEVLNRLGIAEEMKGKLVPNRGGAFHAERVVKGEADLAVQGDFEIRGVKGAAFVPYPPEFQRSIVFVAGNGTSSADPARARQFIAFLQGPETAAAIKARCLSPAS
jgi:molybdate transport system substrate-binding protein